VRRSSDNTEQDIGFDSAGNLDTAQLRAFVGSGNGSVSTWYDQSGNGYHATQGTEGNRPRIVNAGVVDTMNGKPAVQFVSANKTTMRYEGQYFGTADNTIIAPIYGGGDYQGGIITTSANGSEGRSLVIDAYKPMYLSYSYVYDWAKSTEITNTAGILSGKTSGSTAYLYQNGNLIASSTVTTPTLSAGIDIGRYRYNQDAYYSNSKIPEIIVYNSALTDEQRTTIEQDQMKYYGIINLSEAEPTLTIDVGGTSRTATYVGGSGTNTHTYRYMVHPNDNVSDGITFSSPIDLNFTGTIKDMAGNDATLTFTTPFEFEPSEGEDDASYSEEEESETTSEGGEARIVYDGNWSDDSQTKQFNLDGENPEDYLGRYVVFGGLTGVVEEGITWRIIHVDGSQALLFSEEIVRMMPFDTKSRNDWQSSDIHAWLNDEGDGGFLNRFNENERSVISETEYTALLSKYDLPPEDNFYVSSYVRGPADIRLGESFRGNFAGNPQFTTGDISRVEFMTSLREQAKTDKIAEAILTILTENGERELKNNQEFLGAINALIEDENLIDKIVEDHFPEGREAFINQLLGLNQQD